MAALRTSWRTGKLGFFVRLVFLCGVSAVYAWLVHRTYAKFGDDAGLVMVIAGGFFLYITWTMVMGFHQPPAAGQPGQGRAAHTAQRPRFEQQLVQQFVQLVQQLVRRWWAQWRRGCLG